MIDYNNKGNLKSQIIADVEDLQNLKKSYKKKIELYNIYLDTIDDLEEENMLKKELNINELKDNINCFNKQINIINKNVIILKAFFQYYELQKKAVIKKEITNKYNQLYEKIKNNYINNCFLEEDITTKYLNCLINDFSIHLEKVKKTQKFEAEKDTTMNEENTVSSNKLENNDTLLISEKEGKVFLPYTAKEVLELFESNKYQTIEEVIEKEFTRNFSDYRVQFMSRYKETMKLAREKENYGLIDSMSLATEMMKKRLLHPAIITACRNLNELDVYLDCLDKNELDDFKIFKIKYELYPMVVKKKRKIGEHDI